MSQSPYVSVVTGDTFEQAVLQRSHDVPVLVDFWADWCNPCRILMPLLAKLADDYKGAFHLAKVDTEDQRELAAAMGIRSLPTVRLFINGQVIDEFAGALPENEIRSFIDKYLPQQVDQDLADACALISSGDLEQGSKNLEQLHSENPNHLPTTLTLARYYIEQQQYDQADTLLKGLGIADANREEVIQTKTQLKFSRILRDAPTLDALKKQTAEQPDNIEAWYQLGIRLSQQQDYEAALESDLTVMRLDRRYQDDVGRKSILDVFALLNESGPLVNRYRAKMASILH